MDMEFLNPHSDYGSIVTGERFVGRDREINTLNSRLFGLTSYGSIAIIGLPRIGKTSLVSEAVRRARERNTNFLWISVRINLGVFSSVDDLFRSLIEELHHEVRAFSADFKLIEKRVNQTLESSCIDFSQVSAVFKEFRRAGVRPVCILDEFDAGRRVFEKSPQFFHWLRELCSNPEYKAAVVFIAKRTLEDVARLSGYQSDYWANVLMVLTLRPFSNDEVSLFYQKIETNGYHTDEAQQGLVTDYLAGHPYLLDKFAYHLLEHVHQGNRIELRWIETMCADIFKAYYHQILSLIGEGQMLSKAIRVLCEYRHNVTFNDIDSLCETGILVRDDAGSLRGFSCAFERYLCSSNQFNNDHQIRLDAAPTHPEAPKPLVTDPNLYAALIKAKEKGLLVPFIGAGLSLGLDVKGGFPSWRDLPRRLLEECDTHFVWQDVHDRRTLRERFLMTDPVDQTSESNRPMPLKEMLRQLDQVKDKLGTDYATAITSIFRPEGAQPGAAHHAIVALKAPLVITSNYDKLFEIAEQSPTRTIYTGKRGADALADITRKSFVLFKVHGTVDDADSIVLTLNEYERAQADEAYRRVMSYLLTQHTIIFVGYAMADPQDLDLLLANNAELLKNATGLHFALLKVLDDAQEEAVRKERLRREFRVVVISYHNYGDVAPFLESLARD